MKLRILSNINQPFYIVIYKVYYSTIKCILYLLFKHPSGATIEQKSSLGWWPESKKLKLWLKFEPDLSVSYTTIYGKACYLYCMLPRSSIKYQVTVHFMSSGWGFSTDVRRWLCKRRVLGSNPIWYQHFILQIYKVISTIICLCQIIFHNQWTYKNSKSYSLKIDARNVFKIFLKCEIS